MTITRRALIIFLSRITAFLGIAAFFWWPHIDWLLVGIFFFMTSVCVFTIDLRKNTLIVLIGMLGGLCIEGWGTQTNLWHYYTKERPPLWIIPAWATAALTVDALARMTARQVLRWISPRIFTILAWIVFGFFVLLMGWFVRPFFWYPTTIAAFGVVLFVVLSVWRGTCDRRIAVLIFLLGTALGWFLELWGTTRHCWIYYTRQTPPLFAVLAHGLASVAFWRTHLIADEVIRRFFPRYRGHWSHAFADEPPSAHTPR